MILAARQSIQLYEPTYLVPVICTIARVNSLLGLGITSSGSKCRPCLMSNFLRLTIVCDKDWVGEGVTVTVDWDHRKTSIYGERPLQRGCWGSTYIVQNSVRILIDSPIADPQCARRNKQHGLFVLSFLSRLWITHCRRRGPEHLSVKTAENKCIDGTEKRSDNDVEICTKRGPIHIDNIELAEKTEKKNCWVLVCQVSPSSESVASTILQSIHLGSMSNLAAGIYFLSLKKSCASMRILTVRWTFTPVVFCLGMMRGRP